MDRFKKNFRIIFCALLAAVILISGFPVQKVMAAQKEGLVYSKTEGKYYFYKNGKKVKKAWKTVDGNRYYFSKNGDACAAEKIPGINYNICVKKIDGKFYGFDNKGRMVKGLYCTMERKLHYFSTKTGVYSSSASKKYREAAIYEKDAAAIKKLLGKPKKITKMESCYSSGGMDYILNYKKYELTIFHNDKTGKETVLGIMPL